jgi:hypothetical protein
VNAAELLAALRTRGVELRVAGERLRFRPVAAVTTDELEALRAHKAAVLTLLADLAELERDGTAAKLRAIARTLISEEHAQRLAAEAAAGDQLAQLILQAVACIPDPAGWRLYSRRLDRELWVARDATAANELDGDGVRGDLPVVLADDLEPLRDFDDRRLNNLLDVLIHFPGAGLVELDTEAAS